MAGLVVRSRRVVTAEGIRPAAIHTSNGKIERIDDYKSGAGDDYGDLVVMPGLVDSHVHVNEPGRTDWEGFETATRAAAAGGVTTIVDMPLNSIPPTTSVDALEAKKQAIEGKVWVDVGLWGGAVPENRDDLRPLLDAGALGFKCFLVDSGVPEFGFLTLQQLAHTAEVLSDTGAPILVHAELGDYLREVGDDGYAAYLESRPAEAEDAAIEEVVTIAARTGAWFHIVHLSSAGALPILRRARKAGVAVTVETTPHYLFFTAEEIPSRGTEYKCAPPIRDSVNRERLWDALDEGLIDLIVTDHSPAPPEMKKGSFAEAWGGIASLQFGLSAVWTRAVERAFTQHDLVRWMCQLPARLAGLSEQKGSIVPGLDADLVVWDPDEIFTVETIEHRHKVTPYRGMTLRGVVKATYLRGKKVFENGKFLGTPSGVWVR